MTQCRILFFGAGVCLLWFCLKAFVSSMSQSTKRSLFQMIILGRFGVVFLWHILAKKKNILRPDITDEFTEVHKVKKKRRQPSGPLVLTRFGSAVQKHKNALYPLIKHFCSQSKHFKPAKSNFIKTLTEEKSRFTLTVLAAHRTYLILFFFHLSPLCSNICTK